MSTRTRTLAITIAVVLSVATVTSGCGGEEEGTGGRPTVQQLSAKLRNEIGTTPAQGECLAEVYLSSDISDAALAEMYDDQLAQSEVPFTDAELSDDDGQALAAVTDDLTRCIGGTPPTAPTAPTTAPPPGSTEPGATAPGTDTTGPGATDPAAGTTTAPAG